MVEQVRASCAERAKLLCVRCMLYLGYSVWGTAYNTAHTTMINYFHRVALHCLAIGSKSINTPVREHQHGTTSTRTVPFRALFLSYIHLSLKATLSSAQEKNKVCCKRNGVLLKKQLESTDSRARNLRKRSFISREMKNKHRTRLFRRFLGRRLKIKTPHCKKKNVMC